MEKQNAVTKLKESIRILEIRQAEEGQQFNAQLRITYESLKPINLIKNSIKDLADSFEIKNSLFETIFSIVSGYFAQRMIVSSKSNIFKKLLGVLMQFGVNNIVLRNIETIRIFVSNLFEKIINPNEDYLEEEFEEEVPETEV
ncbi:MAG: hypothetical protein Q7J86_06440 [Bacteroidota bacterium]|nr:hypothetical protein [Bacteroidota bacterium]MDO9614148.1 hypothetical protein [Bacteroidota bacterium]